MNARQADWTIRFKGYLPIDDRMEDRLRRVVAEIDSVPESALDVDEINHVVTIDYSQVRGWLEASREVVHVLRAGERTVVKPPWEDYQPAEGEIVIEIDAGEVFGSGLHETTRLCLQALERHVTAGCKVVDFGTGSGILAIAAAKLGAEMVTAIDGDSEAAEVARANVVRNGVGELVEVMCLDRPAGDPGSADLVVANITADTILAHLEALAALAHQSGMLVLSGMTRRTFPRVEEVLIASGFGVIRATDDEWVALVATREESLQG